MHALSDLFLDARDAMLFLTVFENRFGIGLTEYEEQFFDLMNNYLD